MKRLHQINRLPTSMTVLFKNKIICIIGMHRSGTSMVANILRHSGLDLGPDEQFISALAENPQGFFEHQPIVDLNDELLAHFGGRWYAPPDFPESWENAASLQPFKEKALQLIEPFQKTPVWGWKDPRTTLLLPFWRSILPNLTVIICLRNPLDVAQSLKKRNSMDITAAGYIWEKYTLAAIKNSTGLLRMVTFYEDYFSNTAQSEIERLQTFCGLRGKKKHSDFNDLIDKNLLHHQSTISDMMAHQQLLPEHLMLYLELRMLARQCAVAETDDDPWDGVLQVNARFRRDENALNALLREKTLNTEKMFQDFTVEITGINETFKRQQNQLDAKEALVSRQHEELVLRDTQLNAQQTKLTEKEALANRQQLAFAEQDRQIKHLQAEINTQKTQLDQQQAETAQKGEYIERLQTELSSKETLVNRQQAEIVQKDTDFRQLKANLGAKETLINRQQAEIAQKDTDFQELKANLGAKERKLDQQQAEIVKKESYSRHQQAEIGKRGALIKRQQAMLAEKEARLSSANRRANGLAEALKIVQRSLSWRITAPLRFGFDALLFSTSPKKWRARFLSISAAYNRIAEELRNSTLRDFFAVRLYYLKYHGLWGYFKNIYRELHNFTPPSRNGKPASPAVRQGLPAAQINQAAPAVFPDTQEPKIVPEISPLVQKKKITLEITPVIQDVIISVVIPVKNAGSEFRFLLSLLKKQRGFKAVEIVIVDSGSTDGSLEVARAYGAKIVQITPDEFSHSYARNLGAENASGEYVLFTVQDALPPSETWLYELFLGLKKGDVVAASCAEVPREDADMFYRVMCWNHYRFMEVDQTDRILSQPASDDYKALRKNAQVSDIACLIERDVFAKYRYRNDYAEDLDLGIRLIKDGYRLALLGSVKIIHSHNRVPYYHLRRGFVEKVVISKILPDQPDIKRKPDALFRDFLFAFKVLDAIVFREIKQITLPCAPQTIFEIVKEKLRQAIQNQYLPNIEVDTNGYLDEQFQSFLERIKEHAALPNGKPDPVKNSILLNAVNGFTGFIFEYMTNVYEQIDETVLEEFNACLYKAGAFFSGIHLGASYLRGGKKTTEGIDIFYKELTAGV